MAKCSASFGTRLVIGCILNAHSLAPVLQQSVAKTVSVCLCVRISESTGMCANPVHDPCVAVASAYEKSWQWFYLT
jgi:hypothetical protein